MAEEILARPGALRGASRVPVPVITELLPTDSTSTSTSPSPTEDNAEPSTNSTTINETDVINNISAVDMDFASRGISKSVWCVCSSGERQYTCGGMFYSLLQCDPQCANVCRQK